ncbi:hypothetical protein NW754_000667 [Fusarium falciforme]|nr:hypothetical protein NW754_000667 [Fusarium falciforme]
MAAKTTIVVPHLGGIKAGYRLSGDAVDPSKPTVVLVNSMCTTSSLFDAQFSSKALTDAVNLLAIEPLGHGATSSPSEHFTYWDSAVMSLQVLEALGIDKAFALGTSQGGWIVVRMALLAPEKILGVLPLGTSMDYESSESREKGCWDPKTSLRPFYDSWDSATPTPDFVVDEVWRGLVSSVGFGTNPSAETLSFWDETLKQVYSGDEGRRSSEPPSPISSSVMACCFAFVMSSALSTGFRAPRTPCSARMSLLSTSSSLSQAPRLHSPLWMVPATT